MQRPIPRPQVQAAGILTPENAREALDQYNEKQINMLLSNCRDHGALDALYNAVSQVQSSALQRGEPAQHGSLDSASLQAIQATIRARASELNKAQLREMGVGFQALTQHHPKYPPPAHPSSRRHTQHNPTGAPHGQTQRSPQDEGQAQGPSRPQRPRRRRRT